MQNIAFKIPEKAGQTKIQQVIHAISEAIANGRLKEGETLPSVNRLSRDTGFSRDTIFKAYKALKKSNLIDSAPMRGYYVTGGSYRVFILLDDFSAFKEQLYHSFRNNLPESYSVDLLFHHYNREVFTQLVENSLGRYSLYIVMNIDNKGMEPVLGKIDTDRLLILDMGKPLSTDISFIVQDFDEAVFKCLEEGLEPLKKYSELVMVYDQKETPHPAETVLAVSRFCDKHNIGYRKVEKPFHQEVKKGQCWFIIRDSDLVEVIKKCRAKGLRTGKDIGMLSYNDTPMKQIVEGGISVISTNFEKMGQLASGFVKTRQKITKVLPTSLILRESV
ncbi:MAG: GntR family transcriptional regulator [Mariniphaga sp.]